MRNSSRSTSNLFLSVTAPKIIGVGINYLKERVKGPPKPVLFLKSWSSICYDPKQLHLSLIDQSKLTYEIQLGVIMKSKAFRVKREQAIKHVAGYFILVDITDSRWGKPGDYVPETLYKSQDGFCPVSPPIQQQIDPYQLELELKVNGQTRQKDFTKNMYFKIDEIIEFTTQYISLNEGDLILSGTPIGSGPLKLSDKVQGFARYKQEVVAELNFTIVK